jgi:uncharacterized protein YhhL (DUF1145 family)
MCFSAEASLATLLIGLVGSSLVYSLGKPTDRILALFLGYVSLMQGIEFILWKHQTCDTIHKSVSVLGATLNGLQPIVLGLLLLTISPRQTYSSEIKNIMVIYLAASLVYGTQYILGDFMCTTPRKDDPHLVWNWTVMPYYELSWLLYILAAVSLSILGMPSLKSGLLFGGSYLITMIVSILIYKRQDMGSMWCFFTVFAPLLYYAYRELGLPI